MSDLPRDVAGELLLRWREPHRRYHGESHLRDGLRALDLLGARRVERIAFWFHDAVHRGSTPSDERASAQLADRMLAGVLPAAEVAEVARLVLLTVAHDPGPDDLSGALVSDADLSALGSAWPGYLGNAAAVRAEMPGLDDETWCALRLSFIDTLVGRAEIYRTPRGRELWEATARCNLVRERALLTTRRGAGRADA